MSRATKARAGGGDTPGAGAMARKIRRARRCRSSGAQACTPRWRRWPRPPSRRGRATIRSRQKACPPRRATADWDAGGPADEAGTGLRGRGPAAVRTARQGGHMGSPALLEQLLAASCERREERRGGTSLRRRACRPARRGEIRLSRSSRGAAVQAWMRWGPGLAAGEAGALDMGPRAWERALALALGVRPWSAASRWHLPAGELLLRCARKPTCRRLA